MRGTARRIAAVVAAATIVLPGCTASADKERGTPTAIGQCATSYTPEQLTQRAWAFDGTIARFGTDTSTGRTYRTATFDVRRWLRGASTAGTITVRFDFPAGNTDSAAARDATVGQRFFVVDGTADTPTEPLPIAYGCGYTQPWSQETAELWSRVLS